MISLCISHLIDPCHKVLGMLLPILVLCIHMCSAHSWRTIENWIDSKDRTEVARRAGVQQMIKNLAMKMIRTKSLASIITSVSAMIVMFERPTVHVGSFTATSFTRDHKDEDACKEIAKHIWNLKVEGAKSLLLQKTESEMVTHISQIMEANGVSNKERFLGIQTASPVLKVFFNQLEFCHAYLKTGSVSLDGTRGLVTVHVIEDAQVDDENGNVVPVYGGSFDIPVDLPFNGILENPLYEKHPKTNEGEYKPPLIAEYLYFWLREGVIWSRALPNLLEKALGKIGTLSWKSVVSDLSHSKYDTVFGNNQSAEGVIKHLKETPKLHTYTHELGAYQWYHWKDTLATLRVLVSDFNASAHILERRKKRKKKLMKIEAMRESGATEDAIKNEEANMNGGGWDRHPNYAGSIGEDRLKVDIRDLCDDLIERSGGGQSNNSLMFHMVEAYIAR